MKKIIELTIVILSLTALVGCSVNKLTVAPGREQSVSAEKLVHLNNELATAFAVYAMMSSNVYLDHDKYFPLEDLGWKKIDFDGEQVPRDRNSYVPKTWFGICLSNHQFDIWEHKQTKKTIIAVKGTDETVDWFFGNLSPFFSIPYKSVKKQVMKYYSKRYPEYANKKPNELPEGGPVSLTGHSLGGGMTLSVSFWEGFNAVVFNPSPRIFDGLGDNNGEAVRKVIYQNGDVLQRLGAIHPKIRNKIPSENIIQASFKFDEGESNHSIYLLAKGLLSCADSEELVNMARKLGIKNRDCNL